MQEGRINDPSVTLPFGLEHLQNLANEQVHFRQGSFSGDKAGQNFEREQNRPNLIADERVSSPAQWSDIVRKGPISGASEQRSQYEYGQVKSRDENRFVGRKCKSLF
jgi:hypothetical protein